MFRTHALPLLSAILLLQSCSEAPPAAKKGSPEFSWQGAQETFEKGDYRKAADHLDTLAKSSNDFSDRAQTWRLALIWGQLKANMDIADKFEYGARENKSNPAPFRRVVNDTRSAAGQLAIQLAEAWQQYKKPSGEVLFDFPFPGGSSAQVGALVQASKGILQPPAEIDNAQRLAVQRGLLLAVSRLTGAGDDVAKARETFRARPVKVSSETFLESMAEALYDASTVFARNKLDRPDTMKLLGGQALEIVKALPPNKERKALAAKIEDSLKKGKS